MSEKKQKIVIVAGDPSGDLHGAHLAQKIKELDPSVELFSAAGENLSKESQTIVNLTGVAVTGIFEVLTYFPKILKSFNLLVKRIDELRPDAVVLIDFPDFNLRLAKKLKAKGFRVIYYISPQLWAWRKNRIKLVKKYVDRMLVIFPFEESFYLEHGVKARYVGHPLLGAPEIKNAQNAPQKEGNRIAFLPGSRAKEVKMHLPLLIEARRLLEDRDLAFTVLKHPELPDDLFEEARACGIAVSEDKNEVLSTSYLAISSSGTATLELALLHIPTVVIYKMGFLSWLILKNIVSIDFISMANIIAQEKVFPELIQYQATPRAIAAYCRKFIDDKAFYAGTRERLGKVRKNLGDAPASLNAARAILKG